MEKKRNGFRVSMWCVVSLFVLAGAVKPGGAAAPSPKVTVEATGYNASTDDETGVINVTVYFQASVEGDGTLVSECGSPTWTWSPSTFGGTPYGSVSGSGTSATLTAHFPAGTADGNYSVSVTATATYPANAEHPLECASDQPFDGSASVTFQVVDGHCATCEE